MGCIQGLYFEGDCMADCSKCRKSNCEMWEDNGEG